VKGDDGEEQEVEITRGEYKEDRRLHFTVRHNRLPSCGHKFDPNGEPRHRNCEMCWFAFFQVHGELTQGLDELFAQHGEKGLLQVRGKKFVKNFLRFMSTLAQWKKTADTSKNATGVTNG